MKNCTSFLHVFLTMHTRIKVIECDILSKPCRQYNQPGPRIRAFIITKGRLSGTACHVGVVPSIAAKNEKKKDVRHKSAFISVRGKIGPV